MALLGTPLQTLASIPPATRALALLLVVLSSAYQYLRYVDPSQNPASAFPYLVLVPGSSLWYPWTIITSSFVEVTIIEVRSWFTHLLCLAHYERRSLSFR